jgi:hypothetical protein
MGHRLPHPYKGWGTLFFSVESAVAEIIHRLYSGFISPTTPQSDKTPSKAGRNAEILARYAAGETVIDLAAEYGISPARVYQIISRRQR